MTDPLVTPGTTMADDRSGLGPAAAEALTRADACWVLARAFCPPPAGWRFAAWSEPLLADLESISDALGLDSGGVSVAFDAEHCRRTAQGLADTDWLVDYAALFLVPPIVVPLNTGLLLEGSLAGTVAQQALQCYARAGYTPSPQFRDLPDHASMQLEFLAHLLERVAGGDDAMRGEADAFVWHFVAQWAPLLREACERAQGRHPAAGVYAALARWLEQCLDAAAND